jgi:hypothetical protein
MALFWKDLGFANSHIFRAQHHDIYNACMALLTVPRPHEDFECITPETVCLRKDITEALEACHCDTEDTFVRQIHAVSDSARDNEAEPCSYSTLGQLLFVVIHNALQPARDENIHKISRNAMKAARAGKQVLWPTKPHELLPYGAKASVEALILWVGIAPQACSLGVLGSMLEICKQQILPYIVDSKTLANQLASITEIILAAWMVRKTAPGSTTRCLDDLKRIALLCHMLVDLCHKSELQKFAGRSVERLLRMGDIVLKWLPQIQNSMESLSASDIREIEYIRTYYIALCSLVHQYFNKPFDSTKFHPLVVSHSLQHMIQQGDPLLVAFQGFLHLAGDQRCFAPGCPETFSSAGRKFHNCAGCKRVPYCSKACQTRAWKHTTVPHKSICKKLDTLAELTSLPSKLTDPMGCAAFVRTFNSKGIDEALAADVAMHMKKLWTEMATASCTLKYIPQYLKLTGTHRKIQ